MNELDLEILRRMMERSVRKVIVEIDAEQRNHLRDLSNETDDEVLEFFYSSLGSSIYNTRSMMERRFFVGLTDNLLSAMQRHTIRQCIGCCRVGSYEQALRVMSVLHNHLGIHAGDVPDPASHPEILADYTILYLARRDAHGFND